MSRLSLRPVVALTCSVALGCAGGFTSSSSSSGEPPSPPVAQTVDAQGATLVAVENRYGVNTILGESRTDVLVTPLLQATRDSSRARLHEVTLRAERKDGRVEVATMVPADLSDVTVALELRVPASLPWDLTAAGHGVVLRGLSGGGSAQTASGDVEGREMTGNITLATANGSVRLETTVTSGDAVVVDSGAGDISLVIPVDTNASLTASAGGGITIRNLTFSGVNTGTEANGSFGAGGGSIELTSSAGAILVEGASTPDGGAG
ncbi:MAG: hypothetical protein AB2A00_38600 [Myxococcota bacterium]